MVIKYSLGNLRIGICISLFKKVTVNEKVTTLITIRDEWTWSKREGEVNETSKCTFLILWTFKPY